MQIWLVKIHTGEYEDRHSAILSVFTSQASAARKQAQLQKELEEQHLHSRAAMEAADIVYNGPEFHGFRVDYTGAWLYLEGPYQVEE